jgi:hypothetical protein
MADAQVNFNAPASLRKWPSINKERRTDAAYPEPYLLFDGTLDECIREMISKPVSQHHLYEIHTAPQEPLVSAMLSAVHAAELARLRESLSP